LELGSAACPWRTQSDVPPKQKKRDMNLRFSFFLMARLPCFLAIHNLFTGRRRTTVEILTAGTGSNQLESANQINGLAVAWPERLKQGISVL
jgi:hypothetical protein